MTSRGAIGSWAAPLGPAAFGARPMTKDEK